MFPSPFDASIKDSKQSSLMTFSKQIKERALIILYVTDKESKTAQVQLGGLIAHTHWKAGIISAAKCNSVGFLRQSATASQLRCNLLWREKKEKKKKILHIFITKKTFNY